MASHSLKLLVPDSEDVQTLPYWYELAGFRCDDPSENVDAYSRALAGGYLGVAAAAAHRKNYQTLMRLQPDQWYHARMSVRVLKLNGRLIGLFVVGPHWQLSG